MTKKKKETDDHEKIGVHDSDRGGGELKKEGGGNGARER